MGILTILQLERKNFLGSATSLRTTAHDVTDFGPLFQATVDDMIDTLKHHKIAIGLAGPQVGIPLKVSVINLNKDKAEPTLVLVNPLISAVSGKKDRKKESCMSLPHFRGEVERRENLTVTYLDRNGKQHTLSAHGFLARAIAHEVDHLQGILYIDRMTEPASLEPVDFF